MENTVDTIMLTESAPDDAAQAQNEGESLATLTAEQPAAQEEAPAQEPGWIKQRIGKAVEKAVTAAKAEVRAEYEAMLAPIRESVLERQAQELVQSGEFKSLERAKEYVRLKNGVPSEPTKNEPQNNPPRDSQGRFQSKEDPDTRARASLLAQQAQKIKTNRGVDVMQAFNSDPGIQSRILSGEWDFYDVADYLDAGQQPRRSVPTPMRSPNGAAASPVSIANMSDEQFERLQQNLARGARYDLRK